MEFPGWRAFVTRVANDTRRRHFKCPPIGSASQTCASRCRLYQNSAHPINFQTLPMIIRVILSAFFLGFTHLSFGQSTLPETKLSSLAKADFGLQGIGLTYEPKLSNKLTIDLSAGAGGGYDIAEGYLNYKLELQKPAFYFSLTPKYFYNRNTRSLEGKSTLLNSGNYIGLRLKYVTPNDRQTDLTRNSILTNIHWGIQRAIGNNFAFNSHVGIGYAQDIDYDFGTLYPSIDFKLSYVFSKRKL